MTEFVHGQPRVLAPRRLEQQETLSSLNHWMGTFKNYYRRCQIYGYFLSPGLSWSPDDNKGFTQSEPAGLKRTPEILASDLEGFLQCIGGYLPFDYIFEKLQAESTCLQSVWDILFETYDVEINTTHFLDYAVMLREPQETYRGFFNRLVGFVRQHLPRNKFEAEGVKCAATGETLTIGLLDAITTHWLNSIDKRLIGIIKTEFSTELKSKRICQMVKTIAPNIDDLIHRYSSQDTTDVSKVVATSPPNSNVHAISQDSSVDTILRRLERLETNAKFQRSGRLFKNKNKTYFNRSKEFCGHCNLINKQLGANLDVRHSAHSCQKKQLSVNVIDMMENNHQENDTEDSDYDGGEVMSLNTYTHPDMLQPMVNNDGSLKSFSECDIIPKSCAINTPNDTSAKENNVSDFKLVNYTQAETLKVEKLNSSQTTGTNLSKTFTSSDYLLASIRKLQSSGYSWQSIQKPKSPRIRGSLKGVSIAALVDTGAEINVLDEDFDKSASIDIIP